MDNKTYTIDEATEYTGIKRRTFERLNLSYTEELRTAKDGKERKVRVYSKSVLDQAKAERDGVKHIPAVVTATNDNPAAQVVTVSDLQTFAGMLLEGINQKSLPASPEETHKKVQDVSRFKDKLILNLSQAFALAGAITHKEIKEAVEGGKIKAKKVGRTWKIHRLSLEEFCDNYFDVTEEANQNSKANSKEAGRN